MDLQDALNLLLGTSRVGARTRPLLVDGVFGPQTRLRLMEYQRSRGMLDDGIVTVEVWQRIRQSLERIPGLVVVRPLGGGGAGACVNVDKNAEEAKKQGDPSEGKKSSEVAAGGAAAMGGSAGASGRGFTFSAERVIPWKSGLTGIDRKGWAGSSTLAEEEGKSQDEKEGAEEKKEEKKEP